MIYYWYYYLLGILLIPGIIMSIRAQIKVNTSFSKYDEKFISSQTPAHKVARHLLDSAGLYEVKITACKGDLTDHFNPKTNTVALSEKVYNNCSLSAVGVMAHELGHVLQYRDKHPLIKLRSFLIPIINISSYFMWPLVIVGIILEFTTYVTAGTVMIYIGIGIFALSSLLMLITLPIEQDASKRALVLLEGTGILSSDETKCVKEVLDAASQTYLAALVTSLLSLLRFVLFIASARKRD